VARTRERRGAYRVLMGKPERKRSLWRRRRIWEDNIRMDLKESRWESVDLIDLVQDTYNWRGLVNKARIPGVPYKEGNFLTS
jgi:hypothetical protein